MSKANTPTTSNPETAQEQMRDCAMCGGLGFLRHDAPVGHPDFGKLYPCACRLDELEAQHARRLQTMGNMDTLSRFTFESFVPGGHALNEQKQQNLVNAFEKAQEFATNPRGWLILLGSYGCGKTHLAAAIANQRISQNHPAVFVNVPDLLDYLRAAYSPFSEVNYDDRFEMVRNAPLLILDDLGTENATPWAGEKLYQILNHRYGAQLPTVITSNYQLDEIDVRLRSRMNDQDMCQIYVILAPDYRGSGGQTDQQVLGTLELHTDQTFATFLDRKDLTAQERENMMNARDKAQEYAQTPKDWLLLTGGHGCGKTHLAAAMANHRASLGHPALFITVPDLLDHLRATFSPASTVSYDRLFSQMRTAGFLVLDDLGTHSATAWAKEKLYQLFNHRFAARLPTVITTALSMEDLEKHDPRLHSRLLNHDRCYVFGLSLPAYFGESFKPSSRRRQRR